jgi:hypothetical protein
MKTVYSIIYDHMAKIDEGRGEGRELSDDERLVGTKDIFVKTD